MDSRDVRRSFLEFFASKGHQVVPSSPLILPSDPTLLFANAGMNQFKEVFRGVEKRPYVRAASSQKCLRVSGKHNDLEEVGRTPRHHTFFEMLGNFSFGDYFKQDAIVWGWELVTEVWGMDPSRLWVTIFEGDDRVGADEEAGKLWQSEAGVSPSRIKALPAKENFWQMGETGPAGPCTEIHVDMNPGGPDDEHPGNTEHRFLEIWNLVFMQYDLQPGGGIESLPAQSVDTGAGLERLTAVLQGKSSNYDTDLFQPIIQKLAGEAGVRYGDAVAQDDSLRVISDHLRAITMLIAEGVIPGPEKRGAVLRRILRRALRHGRMLGLPPVFLHAHVADVIDVLGGAFPELAEAQPIIEKVTRREEERFEKTLSEGLRVLEERIEESLERGTSFPGAEAFTLESERGVPMDLIRDALEERGVPLDEEAYGEARKEHVAVSRVVKEDKGSQLDLSLLGDAAEEGSTFVGYAKQRVEAARALALLDGEAKARVGALEEGQEGELVLDETPFYAESGGQIGDRGALDAPRGRARVLDTRSPAPGVILHRVRVEAGTLAEGDLVVASVDGARRASTRKHHTATHLLHAALRKVLGTHVKQAGSLVAPDRLRFDFAHYEGVSAEDLAAIEDDVNAQVLRDLAVETVEMPIEEALASGAIAFFGDRYGEKVRVVRIEDASTELCGGTHVSRTGEIGPLRILVERGVAAGVRRVEAVVGHEALSRAREDRRTIARFVHTLGAAGSDPLEQLEKKLESLRQLQKENDQLRMDLARGGGGAEGEGPLDVQGVGLLTRRADGLSKGQRRDLADSLRQKHAGAVIVLGAEDGGKAALVVAVGAKVRDRVDARALIKALGPLVGGGGGGRPDLAEAGGKNPGGLDEALGAAEKELASQL